MRLNIYHINQQGPFPDSGLVQVLDGRKVGPDGYVIVRSGLNLCCLVAGPNQTVMVVDGDQKLLEQVKLPELSRMEKGLEGGVVLLKSSVTSTVLSGFRSRWF